MNKYPALENALKEKVEAADKTAQDFSDWFKYDDKVQQAVKEYGWEDDILETRINEFDESEAKLKPKVAEDLARTYNLFMSGEYADERKQGNDIWIKEFCLELGKEIAPNLPLEVEVSERSSNYGNPAVYYEVILGAGDFEEELEILYYTYEPGLSLSEASNSWNWAFWLGNSVSPLYADYFVDAYDEDQESSALEEMIALIKESQDYWDLKDAIKKLADKYKSQEKGI